jgi:hypothetical protein
MYKNAGITQRESGNLFISWADFRFRGMTKKEGENEKKS